VVKISENEGILPHFINYRLIYDKIEEDVWTLIWYFIDIDMGVDTEEYFDEGCGESIYETVKNKITQYKF
jgi:hypothetical protein